MRKYMIPIILVIVTVFLFTGCDLIFGLFGGGDDGSHHHFYGFSVNESTMYISAYADEKVTTVAKGADINPEDFPVGFEYPHGLVYDPDTDDIWVCDLNDASIKQYHSNDITATPTRTLLNTVNVGSQPVNALIIPEFTVSGEAEARLKRLLVADRKDNCIYVRPFDGGSYAPQGWSLLDMKDSAAGFIDMYYDPTDHTLYVVSDEFFGFQSFDLATDSEPTAEPHSFTGTNGIMKESIDWGGTGITMHGGRLYINTGGRIISCDPDGSNAEVVCVMAGVIYPEANGMYVDIEISNELRVEDFTQRNRLLTPPDPYYIYITSGFFWNQDTVPMHLLRCDLDGGTFYEMPITIP